MSTPCLQTLSVELLHRIFNNLDADTIILSFRNVCRRFCAISNTYNQYKLDFHSFSKTNFHQICQVIHSKNVISLILSDEDETPGQIGLFLSLIDVNTFNRLQSLTLCSIEESSLNTFLNHTSLFSLKSLSIKGRVRLNSNTTNLLSTTIEKLTNLQKLDLKIENYPIENIQWSHNNSIQYLLLDRCTLKQLFYILRHLSQLRTLILSNFSVNRNETILVDPCEFTSSLKSLTIELKHMSMDMFQSILTLTPELIHLKLTDWTRLSDSLYDGFRWENFIRRSLSHLKKFEFFFYINVLEEQTLTDIESIIAPFRTSFWLECKCWYVTCDYIKDLDLFQLYSIPICESTFSYEYESSKMSCSTMSTMNLDPASMMDNVYNLQVDLIPTMIDAAFEKNELPVQRLFNNVSKLSLWAINDWPENSTDYLSSLIDLSHLRKLSLDLDLDRHSLQNATTIINNLLKHAYNVRSIEIPYPLSSDPIGQNIETICSILSTQVKHLKVNVHNLIEMKMILDRIEHLSSVVFNSSQYLSTDYDEIIEWLKQKQIHLIHLKYDSFLSIWF